MQLLYGKYIGQVADHVLDLIETQRQVGQFRRAFLIVPDARTLSLEQRYLQRLANGSLMRAEILSFGRLALRFAGEAALPLPPSLSAQSQALLIRDILLSQKEAFRLLNPLARKPGYLENLRVELASLRRLGFNAAALANMAEIASLQSLDDTAADKFKELSHLAEKYEQTLTELGRRDGSADLDLLAELLESWASNQSLPSALKNSAFFILGFGENRLFSYQEERVIHALENLGQSVTVACVADYCPSNLESADRGAMAWRQGRRVLLKLASAYPSAKVSAVKSTPTTSAQQAEHLYAAAQAADEPVTSVEEQRKSQLIAAEDMRLLIEKVLAYIQKKVKEEGWRYQDFTLCLCDSQAAMRYLPQALADFGIPAFIDEREQLIQSRIFRELSAFMHLSLSNYDLQALCSLLRLNIAKADLREVDLFENFCLMHGIKGYKLFLPKYYSKDYQQERSSEAWLFAKQHVLPLKALTDAFRRCKTITEAVTAVLSYLELSDAELRMNQLYDEEMLSGNAEAARSLSLSWNSLLALLEDSHSLIPSGSMNARDFRELVVRAASSSYIGAVPSLLDEVYVGNPHTSLSQRPRQVIMMNPSVTNLPGRVTRQGILNDLDYVFLEKNSERRLPLSPEDAPFEDSFFIQQLLAAGQEMPLIACSRQDKALPHFLLNFLGLSNYDALDAAINQGIKSLALERLFSQRLRNEKAWFAKYGSSPMRGAELQALKMSEAEDFSRDAIYSASRLERYTACPYSYLMQYILGIGARPELQLDDASGGQLRHLLMEKLFTPLLSQNGLLLETEAKRALLGDLENHLNLRALTEQIKILVAQGEISDSYLDLGVFGKTTRPILQAVSAAGALNVDHFANDMRWPIATEWMFGVGGKPNLKLTDVDNPGFQVNLRGLVDRIDITSVGGLERYAVTDYKSSKRTIDYIALWEGLDLQLPIYLLAVKDAFQLEAKQLGEASYFHLKRFGESLLQNMPKSELKKLESSLQLDLLERTVMLEKSQMEIVKAAKSIAAGYFPLKPRAASGKSSCTFCEVRTLCGFDRPENEVRIEHESNVKAWRERAAEELAQAEKKAAEGDSNGIN